MTRDSAEGISIASGVVCIGLTAFFPAILANNEFLRNYVTHEILSLLSVTMTITFASVANIHLAITKSLRSSIKDQKARARIEKSHGVPMRREINSSAWLLFWAFLAIFVAVLVKGEWPKNIYVLSTVHGMGIVATIINMLVIRDIYRMTFLLAADPMHSENAVEGD